jgi:hypothetical protein
MGINLNSKLSLPVEFGNRFQTHQEKIMIHGSDKKVSTRLPPDPSAVAQ